MDKLTIEKKINELLGTRDELLKKIRDLDSKLDDLLDKKLELESDKVKVICLTCNGNGFIRTDDNRKVICKTCRGKKFIWALKFEE
ncbi:MAG: hypothetical protein DRQ06_05965 [Candidatus Hydrothermota bacterium]|nr:MAG: hypothetical protein DRQ06_05965 [Candidatus Hydrothermae bacterium]